MKKVLLGLFALSAAAFAYEGTNVYLRAGLDPYGRFKEVKHENVNIGKSSRKNLGYELSVEATENVTPNFDLGLGLGYQDHGRPKAGKTEDKEFGTLPRFKSVPLYVTAKYDIPVDSRFNPYLKADLGYSFNIKSKKTINYDGDEFRTSYKNGMYWGIGVGVEFDNVVADLMYKMNYGKVKVENKETGDSANPKINYGRVTLAVGYRFNF
ncbi:outer membrane beta-barrel protein [Fusobacterium sp.]|uniref:outer membrane beta-barrel protein n=1 Tax=Fusobacterium sp. TaxID=68766 RepID=UPI00396CF633